jgi:hypothetical protein
MAVPTMVIYRAIFIDGPAILLGSGRSRCGSRALVCLVTKLPCLVTKHPHHSPAQWSCLSGQKRDIPPANLMYGLIQRWGLAIARLTSSVYYPLGKQTRCKRTGNGTARGRLD